MKGKLGLSLLTLFTVFALVFAVGGIVAHANVTHSRTARITQDFSNLPVNVNQTWVNANLPATVSYSRGGWSGILHRQSGIHRLSNTSIRLTYSGTVSCTGTCAIP